MLASHLTHTLLLRRPAPRSLLCQKTQLSGRASSKKQRFYTPSRSHEHPACMQVTCTVSPHNAREGHLAPPASPPPYPSASRLAPTFFLPACISHVCPQLRLLLTPRRQGVVVQSYHGSTTRARQTLPCSWLCSHAARNSAPYTALSRLRREWE